MANQKHLDILKQGVEVWNQWREKHPTIWPDLSGTDLSGAKLIKANLSGADLSGVDLSKADLRAGNLSGVDLSKADLSNADMSGTDEIRGKNPKDIIRFMSEEYWSRIISSGQDRATASGNNPRLLNASLAGSNLYGGTDLSYANLRETNLRETNLRGANFYGANFYKADLREADLSLTRLVKTNLIEANLTNCRIYGIAVWDVQLEQTIQNSLIITPNDETQITVDNLKIAQFIYLLLNNQEIRDVIDTITSKVVLILGRFAPERKAVLNALRDELRKHNYSPVLFDFEKPANRDLTETVRILAHLARFIIAELTEPSSIPLELQAIVPDLAVPVKPLFKVSQESKHEFSMFQDLSNKYNWVLPIYHYTDQASLLQSLKENVIDPAETKAQELGKR